jgi:DNA-binding transcriptional regulator YdaS (Cro superfamily)
MKLNDWISDVAKITPAEFAGRIGVTRQAMSRYCAGERMPDAHMVEKIEKATKGAVTVADLHEMRLSYLRSLDPVPAPLHMDAAS